MNKDLETQPYRIFKEYLDKIIQMPDNLKNELAEVFEKKRLEMQTLEMQRVPPNDDNSFFKINDKNKEEEEEEESEYKEPKLEEPEYKEPKKEEPKLEEPKKEDEKNTLFNRFFSEIQNSPLFTNKPETPSLTPANAPQHKCRIRDW
jgi:hypothetical protein